ncbi:MAG: ORF6N domain-containing protein [Candidatus Manganitrophus sp.]|nr:ORF6N domain-containing protein [Candidatus Manganitrophus sp.]
METIIPTEVIEQKILFIRDQKVMLDADLAQLYQVEVKHLKRQERETLIGFPRISCLS